MNATTDVSQNSTYHISYTSNSIIITITSICIIIGTYFSILYVFRYLRQINLQISFLTLFIHIYCTFSFFYFNTLM